ncbi:Hypothetical predicted protein, partial [Mytilus galloprovincialis]
MVSLIEFLKERNIPVDKVEEDKNIGNDHAAKSERRIELGWLMKEGDRMKQVRGPTGGGTRHLIVDKDTLVSTIKETALKLYFPEGISPR